MPRVLSENSVFHDFYILRVYTIFATKFVVRHNRIMCLYYLERIACEGGALFAYHRFTSSFNSSYLPFISISTSR